MCDPCEPQRGCDLQVENNFFITQTLIEPRPRLLDRKFQKFPNIHSPKPWGYRWTHSHTQPCICLLRSELKPLCTCSPALTH